MHSPKKAREDLGSLVKMYTIRHASKANMTVEVVDKMHIRDVGSDELCAISLDKKAPQDFH
jgi:hypothetical protein